MKQQFLKKNNVRKSAVIASMVLVAMVLVTGPFHILTSYAQQEGNDNQVVGLNWNNSFLAAKMTIDTTLQNSNTGSTQTDGCPSDAVGQFSLQLTDGASIVGTNTVQEGVSVNTQGGYSCFGVSVFQGSNTYCYGFAIGYSQEFYQAGNYVEMELVSDSNGNWVSAWLYVASDTWVIYPDQMTSCDSGSMPSQTINDPTTFTINNLNPSASFTSGAGTITYWSTQTPEVAGCETLTAETSNVYYGNIYPTTPPYVQQSFGITNQNGACGA